MNEWRRAIRTPISYTVPGSSSSLVRQQTNFVSFVIFCGALVLLFLYACMPSTRSTIQSLDEEHGHWHQKTINCDCKNTRFSYNRSYPITPIETLDDGRLKYRIAAVADLDKKSKSDIQNDVYLSYLQYGTLILNPRTLKVEVDLEINEIELNSEFASGGRGMELSELVVFNGKLYTCDDRTGIVYEIRNSIMLPWVILRNGNGLNTAKSFKCEWMVVKDDHLYVGGLGKEWTSATGDVVLNYDPQWVKRISLSGYIEHFDWRSKYLGLRHAAGIDAPGYLIHEAAIWSSKSKFWYFLPRRASKQPYDEVLDEQRGTNMLLMADENFTHINKSAEIGKLIKTHGFSSVKILPLPSEVKLESENWEIAVALKSEEDNNVISSYLTVFLLPEGRIIMPELRFSQKHKYEGIEFV